MDRVAAAGHQPGLHLVQGAEKIELADHGSPVRVYFGEPLLNFLQGKGKVADGAHGLPV